MAQHDYSIANQSGSAFRADLNNGLAAIVSNNSGASQPSTTYAYQWWADTTTGLLKLRNASNAAWVTVGTLASTNLGLLASGGTLTAAAGSEGTPSIAFTGDTNTGIYSPGANQVAISTAGTGRLSVSSTGNVGIGTFVPDGTTHIHTASAGSVNASASADDLTVENSGAGGISILTPDASNSAIFFGSPSDAVGAAIRWNYTNNEFVIGSDRSSASTKLTSGDGATAITIDSSGRCGIGTTSPGEKLDISSGTSGTAAVVKIQDPAGRVIQIASPSVSTESYIGTTTNHRLDFYINNTVKATIDTSGRLLVGTSSAITTFNATGTTANTPALQMAGASEQSSSIGLFCYSTGASADSSLIFNASRSGTVGTHVAVAAGNQIGGIGWAGSDGTAFAGATCITSSVDGTVASGSVPGRLAFLTTAVGASNPTEQFRITNDGVFAYRQNAPTSKSAAATLTIAELKTGIIQYTGAAATLTLPTGTLAEGGFNSVYTNMTFEWSVINTGSGICTIGAGTAHTIVGGATIAAGASGKWASRRTAANTFVSYRLS